MKIVTHSGAVHADELLACAILRSFPEFSKTRIHRTRDDSEISPGDIVVDVGGIYDNSILRYDHHQPSFSETWHYDALSDAAAALRPDYSLGTYKMAAAGLVWRHYGQRWVRDFVRMFDLDLENYIDDIWHLLYSRFVVQVDAKDNGQAEELCCAFGSKEGVSFAIRQIMPRDNELEPPEGDKTASLNTIWVGTQMKGFLKGVELIGIALRLEAKAIVNDLVNAERFAAALATLAPQDKVLTLDANVALSEAYYKMEAARGLCVDFLIWERSDHNWNCMCVPPCYGSFAKRTPLPKAWAGLRDAELAQVSGIEDAVFCHVACFLGVAKSRESAEKMAKIALGQTEE